MSRTFRCKKATKAAFLALPLLANLASAQQPKYEATFLVGGRYGGSVGLQESSKPNTEAKVADSFSFGLSAGFRIEAEDGGYDVIGFRWLRQSTHLYFKEDPLTPSPTTADPFRPSITLDHFLGDFTHEFVVSEFPVIQPFATASLGVARLSAPASSATRFAFGIGGGINVFPKKHWGVRVGVEYLPTVMHVDLQRLVCAVGCTFVLGGGLMNQFQVSVGPAFRF